MAAVFRDARLAGAGAIDEAELTPAIAQARLEARATVAEMRKSWDRAAQDVFSAFVERLAAERDNSDPSPQTG